VGTTDHIPKKIKIKKDSPTKGKINQERESASGKTLNMEKLHREEINLKKGNRKQQTIQTEKEKKDDGIIRNNRLVEEGRIHKKKKGGKQGTKDIRT